MFRVYKSDTDQFILVHEPSQTVIIDDSLERGYSRIERHVAEHFPGGSDSTEQPFSELGTAPTGGAMKTAGLVLWVLLPLLWLAGLHYAFTGLLNDLRTNTVTPADVERLTDEVNALRETVERLQPAPAAPSPPAE